MFSEYSVHAGRKLFKKILSDLASFSSLHRHSCPHGVANYMVHSALKLVQTTVPFFGRILQNA